MRYNEIKPLIEQRLDEINMSPASLRQLASKIDGAKAGLEFELVIPGTSDDDGEMEPDYDQDERSRSIDDVIAFFDDGNYNGNREIRRLREILQEEFWEWQTDQVDDAWANTDQAGVVAEYIKNNVDLEDEDFDAAVEEAMETQDVHYDEARSEWEEDHRDEDYSDEDWIRREYPYMSDIEGAFMGNAGISWPHYTTSSSGDVDTETVADSFADAVGRPVKHSGSHHGVSRHTDGDNFYIAEPDASITGENGEGGLEFVSPPLSISEMISDLNKVVKWCKSSGAYTNSSTGLHMNISVPNYSLEKLDFIKLALLMGDEHILTEFGRMGSTYCKSGIDIVKKNIKQNPDNAAKLLGQMKAHLNTAASKLIHDGATNKFTSINTKDGRVEFRSPGDDWLADFDSGKVENTLLRFVVALDAAVDETKYKDEYAKKLYKLLAPTDDSTNTMQYFTKYVAGDMPKAALKSFVKQARLNRNIKKTGGTQKMWWKVEMRPGTTVEVVATTEEEAKEAAAKEWGLTPQPYIYQPFKAVALRPFEEDGKYEMYDLESGEQIMDLDATNLTDAWHEVNNALNDLPDVNRNNVGVRAVKKQAAQTSSNPDRERDMQNARDFGARYGGLQDYELYRLDNDEQVTVFAARTNQEALDRGEVYLRTQGWGNAGFNVRTRMAGDDARRARQAGPAAPGTVPPRAAELPPQTNRIFWQVVGDNGQFVSVDAADEQEAQASAHRRYGDALGNPANYEITRIES